MEADMVVIGSGTTGLSAAVTAVERGTTVIVFEIKRSLGRTSRNSGSIAGKRPAANLGG